LSELNKKLTASTVPQLPGYIEDTILYKYWGFNKYVGLLYKMIGKPTKFS